MSHATDPSPSPATSADPPPAKPRRTFEEPEVLPLELAGNWIAWSGDGLRIVAYAPELVEAERLAHAAGEPEPILQRHPGRYRL